MDGDEHILGSCELLRDKAKEREIMVNSDEGNVKCEVYKGHSCKQRCTNGSVVYADCTVHDEGHRTEDHDDTSLLSNLEKTDETLVERPTSIGKEELVPDGGWGWVIVFGASLILVSVNQISELLRQTKCLCYTCFNDCMIFVRSV